jgi:hypothetical protein
VLRPREIEPHMCYLCVSDALQTICYHYVPMGPLSRNHRMKKELRICHSFLQSFKVIQIYDSEVKGRLGGVNRSGLEGVKHQEWYFKRKSPFPYLGNDISETSENKIKDSTKFYILGRHPHHMPGNM